jgi:hypothetical protein
VCEGAAPWAGAHAGSRSDTSCAAKLDCLPQGTRRNSKVAKMQVSLMILAKPPHACAREFRLPIN